LLRGPPGASKFAICWRLEVVGSPLTALRGHHCVKSALPIGAFACWSVEASLDCLEAPGGGPHAESGSWEAQGSGVSVSRHRQHMQLTSWRGVGRGSSACLRAHAAPPCRQTFKGHAPMQAMHHAGGATTQLVLSTQGERQTGPSTSSRCFEPIRHSPRERQPGLSCNAPELQTADAMTTAAFQSTPTAPRAPLMSDTGHQLNGRI
jgi:hypothetical protein